MSAPTRIIGLDDDRLLDARVAAHVDLRCARDVEEAIALSSRAAGGEKLPKQACTGCGTLTTLVFSDGTACCPAKDCVNSRCDSHLRAAQAGFA